MADDDVAFNTSAFDVVGSWLLGGKSASASNPRAEENGSVRASQATRAPVSLYRPSSKTAGLTAGSAASATNGKVLTEEEKEMKKKLLRKSGTYRHQQQQEAELEAPETQQKQDEEEEALLRAKHGEPTGSKGGANGSKVGSGEKANEEKTLSIDASNPKKRKVSAQDELLEKLREEAARKKAKNLKAKQRLQRKKEAAKTQQPASGEGGGS